MSEIKAFFVATMLTVVYSLAVVWRQSTLGYVTLAISAVTLILHLF